MVSPKLIELHLCHQKLPIQAMKAFFNMLCKLLECRAPLHTLNLTSYSVEEFEGKKLLNFLVSSGINSLRRLILADLPVWFENDECLQRLTQILSQQQQIEELNL